MLGAATFQFDITFGISTLRRDFALVIKFTSTS